MERPTYKPDEPWVVAFYQTHGQTVGAYLVTGCSNPACNCHESSYRFVLGFRDRYLASLSSPAAPPTTKIPLHKLTFGQAKSLCLHHCPPEIAPMVAACDPYDGIRYGLERVPLPVRKILDDATAARTLPLWIQYFNQMDAASHNPRGTIPHLRRVLRSRPSRTTPQRSRFELVRAKAARLAPTTMEPGRVGIPFPRPCIGIELEGFIPIDDGATEGDTRDALLEALPFYCRVHGDGSIRHGISQTDTEVVLLTYPKKMRDHLNRTMDVLDGFGFRVNDSCGMHVHIDCLHDAHQLSLASTRLGRWLPILQWLVAPSRRSNEYCRLHRYDGRYNAINTEAFREHGTVEVRLHQGTSRADRAHNWASLVFQIATTSRYPTRVTLPDNLRRLGIPTPEIDFWCDRYTRFGGPDIRRCVEWAIGRVILPPLESMDSPAFTPSTLNPNS